MSSPTRSKLLHPFMPFITEEIWQTLPHNGESIMIARPIPVRPSLVFEEEAAVYAIIAAIRAVRNRRSEMNVPASRKAHLYIARARCLNAARPFPQSLRPRPT